MIAAGRILSIFSSALLAVFLTAASAAAAPNREPLPHADEADVSDSPLDLRSVSFGQRGTELVLRIATAGDWELAQLSSIEGRALCVKIFYGALRTPRGVVCVYDKGADEPGLTYSRLDPFGQPVENRIIGATAFRRDKRSVEALLEPSSINLRQGPYSWQAQSTWSCTGPATCNDLSPDNGVVRAQIRPLAEPRCLGAASRNPRYRCRNDELRLAVIPTPEVAALSPNARCTIVSTRLPYTCQFGVRAAIANRTIALIGDSHAAHWRGATEVVAQARSWRGFSLTRSGCPYSTAAPDLPAARRRSCEEWRRAVRLWLVRHPQVQTVFVSQLASAGVRAPRRANREAYKIRGYMRAWRQLPRSVRRVIVLRDTPYSTKDSPFCVERAIRQRRSAATACALRRGSAVRHDAAAVAARRDGSRRTHVVDLNDFMCGPRVCFPVVGGVLVHKDTTHITSLFATTLGPFLLQRVSRLLGG